MGRHKIRKEFKTVAGRGNRTFDENMVRGIRYLAGTLTNADIAERLGVRPAIIYNIVERNTYKDVI